MAISMSTVKASGKNVSPWEYEAQRKADLSSEAGDKANRRQGQLDYDNYQLALKGLEETARANGLNIDLGWASILAQQQEGQANRDFTADQNAANRLLAQQIADTDAKIKAQIAADDRKAAQELLDKTIAANKALQDQASKDATSSAQMSTIGTVAGTVGGGYLLSDSTVVSKAFSKLANKLGFTDTQVAAAVKPPPTQGATAGAITPTPSTLPDATGGAGQVGLNQSPTDYAMSQYKAQNPIGNYDNMSFNQTATTPGATVQAPGATVPGAAAPATTGTGAAPLTDIGGGAYNLADAPVGYSDWGAGGGATPGGVEGPAPGSSIGSAANVVGMILATQALREGLGGQGKGFDEKTQSERFFDRPATATMLPFASISNSNDPIYKELTRLDSQISAPVDYAAKGVLGMLGGKGLSSFWGGGGERGFTPEEIETFNKGFDTISQKYKDTGRKGPTAEEYQSIIQKPAAIISSGDTMLGLGDPYQGVAATDQYYTNKFQDLIYNTGIPNAEFGPESNNWAGTLSPLELQALAKGSPYAPIQWNPTTGKWDTPQEMRTDIDVSKPYNMTAGTSLYKPTLAADYFGAPVGNLTAAAPDPTKPDPSLGGMTPADYAAAQKKYNGTVNPFFTF